MLRSYIKNRPKVALKVFEIIQRDLLGMIKSGMVGFVPKKNDILINVRAKQIFRDNKDEFYMIDGFSKEIIDDSFIHDLLAIERTSTINRKTVKCYGVKYSILKNRFRFTRLFVT